MNMMQKFSSQSSFMLLAAIAAYIIGILLIFCPDKLLKRHGIVDPKRKKIARIIGIAVIIVIDVIIIGMYILNH